MRDLFDLLVEKLNIKTEKRADTALVLRKVLPAVATGLLLVFVFLTFAESTFSWFAKNRKVGASGMQVIVAYDDMETFFHVYKYAAAGLEEKAKEIDKDGVTYDINSGFEFLQYDTIFKEANKYTPVIVHMEIQSEQLKGTAVTVTLELTVERPQMSVDNSLEGEYVYVDGEETVEGETEGEVKYELNDYVSSAIRFYCGKDATYDTVIDTLYNNVKTAATASTPWANDIFTVQPVKDGQFFHKNKISFAVEFDEDDWRGNTLDLYLYMDYDTTFTQILGGGASGFGSSFETGNEVVLQNDIKTLKISHN